MTATRAEVLGHVLERGGAFQPDTCGGTMNPFSAHWSSIRLDSPLGAVSARIQLISLGFTVLLDGEQHEVIVPNNVMMSSTIIRVERGPD